MPDFAHDMERATVLTLGPGDALLITVARPLSKQVAAEIKDTVRRELGTAVPVIVAPPGTEFAVVREADAHRQGVVDGVLPIAEERTP